MASTSRFEDFILKYPYLIKTILHSLEESRNRYNPSINKKKIKLWKYRKLIGSFDVYIVVLGCESFCSCEMIKRESFINQSIYRKKKEIFWELHTLEYSTRNNVRVVSWRGTAYFGTHVFHLHRLLILWQTYYKVKGFRGLKRLHFSRGHP